MALTALEQQLLISGELRPQSTDLRSLVKQTAFITGVDFYDNYKEFDGSQNPEAQRYLDKMFSVIKSGIRDQQTDGTFRVMVAIIGQVATDVSQVQNADDALWESFVAFNILRALEVVADVRKEEKTAYQAI